MAKKPSEAMTIEEVAEFLRLSTRTIKRLMDDGICFFLGLAIRSDAPGAD
jgi:hypothetical protein